MPVVHHAACNVDMGNSIAIEKELLFYVIEKQRRDGECAKQQREARVVALLAIALVQSCTIIFHG